ncbi:MAG: hypothetical protein HXS54_04270 [Theionarchaea archaeon]|nr:hypothetical protein [Theionarchaea archaeon]
MAMEIIYYLSKFIEETSFFNNQMKLDTMYYLMQGLTYRQIAEKIGKQISYVQRVMDFLRDNGLLYWGRWSPNVYKIGMEKSIVFLDWKDRNLPLEKNYDYTTYVHHVQARSAKILVVYTYPRGDKSKIEGEKGDIITPFYYTHTRFTTPFFRKIDDFVREFFDVFESTKNDEKILTATPSFEPEEIDDHPITVYICKYGEKLPELTPGILTEKLEQDFKDHKEIEISYDKVRNILSRMKDEQVIFPKNALYFDPLSYQKVLVKIQTKEIYRIMETFNQFNMLTRMAKTRKPDIFYLYVQFPFYEFPDVMEIIAELDPTHEAYLETKFVFQDVIYYKWSLDRFLESFGYC